MVTDEFVAELERVRDGFVWRLQADSGKAAERRAKPRFNLRGLANKGPAQDILLCPIGVVCYATTRNLYEPDYWEEAAKQIGLDYVCASELTAAACDRTWKGLEGERYPDARLEALRTLLLQTVGLPVPAAH